MQPSISILETKKKTGFFWKFFESFLKSGKTSTIFLVCKFWNTCRLNRKASLYTKFFQSKDITFSSNLSTERSKSKVFQLVMKEKYSSHVWKLCYLKCKNYQNCIYFFLNLVCHKKTKIKLLLLFLLLLSGKKHKYF